MNGKGSGRRTGADDAAYKASPAIPESPRFRKKPEPPANDWKEEVEEHVTKDGKRITFTVRTASHSNRSIRLVQFDGIADQ